MRNVLKILCVTCLVVFFGSIFVKVDARANSIYPYEGKLDLSGTGWNSYNVGLNSKGKRIACCYSETLGKQVYVTSKYIVKTNNIVDDTVEPAYIIEKSYATTLTEGVYLITPKCAPNSALDVADWNAEDSANLQLWEKTCKVNQLFFLRRDENNQGYYTLTSVYSGKLVEVGWGSKEKDGNIQLYTKNETDSQSWKLIEHEDGYYELVSKVSGLSMDVQGAGRENGNNIIQYESNGTDAQLFRFERVFYNNPEIYVKQKSSRSCTLASAVMVLRKKAELSGKDYSEISEDTVKKVAWGKGGLYNTFTFDGVTMDSASARNVKDKKAYFIELLDKHPEGVVIYAKNQPHAITLVSYHKDTDTFLVADPWGKSIGVIPLVESTIKGKNQEQKINNITTIWTIVK